MWPWLRYVCCCLLKKRKPSFKIGLKKGLRERLGIKVPKSDKVLEQDPYLRLGYGLNAYFDIMIQLMMLMLICMLVTVPIMIQFASHDALAGQSGYFIS